MERATSWQVRNLTVDREILAVLNRHRIWAAYAICDLEAPHRQYARFVGAWRDRELPAAVLLYVAPRFATILPCGSAAGVRAVLAEVTGLPPRISLSVRPQDLASVELRYQVHRSWTMLRMAVRAGEERLAPDTGAALRRLTAGDGPALQAWYARETSAVFTPLMLEHGVYVGAFFEGRMVAVAGTHAVSERYQIAAVGGVSTDPAFRRRGLATATTSAVVQALIRQGITDIVLNVREDNAPAIAAYTRLGFQVHGPFWEGDATLRP